MRDYDFSVEMWLPKKPRVRWLRNALFSLGAVVLGYGGYLAYNGLDQAFKQPMRVEYRGYAPEIPQEQGPWIRPTDWSRKVK